MKGTMTVLLHTVEYDTGNVVIDAHAEDILHDIIHDSIGFDKKTEGTEVLELEDNEENRLPVDVSWKIVNPEAEKWRQVAAMIREEYSKEIDELTECLDETIIDRYHWKQLAEKMYDWLTAYAYSQKIGKGHPVEGLLQEYENTNQNTAIGTATSAK
jgi:hypothetical protein